jgi:GT2 family glycosyltransferase
MNPVLMLTHNAKAMTERALISIMGQDVRDPHLLIIDNGSSDGTREWVREMAGFSYSRYLENRGVSFGWNEGLAMFFEEFDANHVLVVNNDVVLPPWFYSELLSYDLPFVSGNSVDKMSQIETKPERGPLVPHPDFSAFLIRREAWEKVGPFDENMKHYASDNDWHVRAHRAGVKLWKANLPFYHERSSTLRLASPEERAEIEEQANKDRAVFQSKYGCIPWGPGYDELFK